MGSHDVDGGEPAKGQFDESSHGRKRLRNFFTRPKVLLNQPPPACVHGRGPAEHDPAAFGVSHGQRKDVAASDELVQLGVADVQVLEPGRVLRPHLDVLLQDGLRVLNLELLPPEKPEQETGI